MCKVVSEEISENDKFLQCFERLDLIERTVLRISNIEGITRQERAQRAGVEPELFDRLVRGAYGQLLQTGSYKISTANQRIQAIFSPKVESAVAI